MTKEHYNLLTKGAQVVTNQKIQWSPKFSIPKGVVGVVYNNAPDTNARFVDFGKYGVCSVRFDEVEETK